MKKTLLSLTLSLMVVFNSIAALANTKAGNINPTKPIGGITYTQDTEDPEPW